MFSKIPEFVTKILEKISVKEGGINMWDAIYERDRT